MIGGQLKDGRSCQLLLPVSQLVPEYLTGEVVALPEGVIGILNGQVGELVRTAGYECIIQLCELPYQDRDRPAVGDDMVEGTDQDVFGRACLDQIGAEQIIRGEIEGSLDEFPDPGGQRRLIGIDEVSGIAQLPSVFI